MLCGRALRFVDMCAAWIWLMAGEFWRQFFEASANVSLSSLAQRDEEDEVSYSQSHEASTCTETTSQTGDETLRHDGEEHEPYGQIDDSILDDIDISGSTPRARPKSSSSDRPRFADLGSSYEALKEELKRDAGTEEDSQLPPITPNARTTAQDISMTPTSSPLNAPSFLPSAKRTGPLLHRVLDKNYYIQATPHTIRKEQRTPANKPSWRDAASPMSSPPVAAPQLRSDIFSSPIRQQYSRPNAPRTPGVSVNPQPREKPKDIFGNIIKKAEKKDEISWESDSDEDAEGVYRELGMSPPKTIQFVLPPSKLLQTPGMLNGLRLTLYTDHF